MAPWDVAIILIGAGLIAALILWIIPWLQVYLTEGIGSENDVAATKFKLRNEARKTLAQILGGLAFLVTVFFTYQSVTVSQEALTVSQKAQDTALQEQITERFTRAVDQLGATDENGKAIEVRLGGVYGLERIANDSPRDWQQVMELLGAYVRQNAPVSGTSDARSADIQAVLTVLGRQKIPEEIPKDSVVFDLRGSNLNYANLIDANLQRTNLAESYLFEAGLAQAHLEHANLRRAYLQGADLTGAELDNADISGADLRNTTGLTQKEIDSTDSGDQTTLLSPGYDKSPSWEYRIPTDVPLPPLKYIPTRFDPLRSFSVKEGWILDQEGERHLYLSQGDSTLNFIRPHTIYDRSRPASHDTQAVPKNLTSWFQGHPHLDTENPREISYGGLDGVQFDAFSEAQPGTSYVECQALDCVPLFRTSDATDEQVKSFVFFDRKRNKIIILDVGGEKVLVTVESPKDQFDAFWSKARVVLNTTKW